MYQPYSCMVLGVGLLLLLGVVVGLVFAFVFTPVYIALSVACLLLLIALGWRISW